MRGRNVGILDVLGVQWLKLPVGVLLLLGIFEVGHLAEYSDLLNEVLERPGMDGEAVVLLGLFQASCFVLFELLRPVDNNLLKLGASQVTEGRILTVRASLL